VSEWSDDIRVVGLAALATDRVIDTMGYHLRTKKNRKKIHEAILYELRRAEVVIPDGTDVR
jgi:hypothetical protein